MECPSLRRHLLPRFLYSQICAFCCCQAKPLSPSSSSRQSDTRSPSSSRKSDMKSQPASPSHHSMRASSGSESLRHTDISPQDSFAVLGPTSLVRSLVLIGMDATKDPKEACLFWALKHLVRPGDSITVLGIVHQIITPMGYKSQANLSDFVGTNRATLESEMRRRLVQFEDKLRLLADVCDNRGVLLDISITAGSPLKTVLVKEAAKMKATHVLLDRHLRKDKKYFKDHLQCEVLAFSEKSQPERVREGNSSHIFDNSGLPFTRLNSSSSTPSSRSSTATSISCDGNSAANSDVTSCKEQANALPLSAAAEKEVTPPGGLSDAFLHRNGHPQQSSDSSAERDAISATSSVSHIEDTSFIDLFMLSSPDGITPIWSSANEEKPSPSRKEIYGGPVNTNEDLWLQPADTSGTNEGMIRPHASSMASSNINGNLRASNLEDSSSSTSLDSHMLECAEKGIISVQTKKNTIQLNDLMRVHDYQYATDSSKKATASNFPHSEVQADPEGTVGDAIEKKRQSAKPIDYAEDFPVKHLSQARPLCSVCKHTSMELGKAPRVYEWLELKDATKNFASENLIAEGGFSFVYRGTLPEGQIVAIKKLKMTTLQNDVQFATEVEALSCAQHRNLVRLLGYGVGGSNDRALVYEYVCNGSLDQHLAGKIGSVLQWSARYKIAIGAARGLRYLHEECRVGCIVHRDMRPNNILLTHDFVPMVGDFGLARLNTDVDAALETQVVGALGFLAPEYVECGQVTSKTDVFSFGVVLLELISGRKAIDLQRAKFEISLVEWARQKIRHHQIRDLIDHRIADSVDMMQLDMMVKAAAFCIKRDPKSRLGMSQILRILEGQKNEFPSEIMPQDPNVDSAVQASARSQIHEDLHQSANRLQVLQSSNRRMSAVPKSWRHWVRPS